MAQKRALIVDDSKSARLFLARILEKYELDVDNAENAESAIEYLTTHLQTGHVPVQVDPIQTLQVQHHMPVQDVIHGHRLDHHHSVTAAHLLDQPATSAVRGGASLDD